MFFGRRKKFRQQAESFFQRGTNIDVIMARTSRNLARRGRIKTLNLLYLRRQKF